jgi:hypothetical protein
MKHWNPHLEILSRERLLELQLNTALKGQQTVKSQIVV